MGQIAQCPPAASIETIPTPVCRDSFGQTQKVIFSRLFSAPGVKNEFVVATADPKVLASWTPLLAASDSTKVVQSPYLTAPTVEPGAARTYGGGNETLGGIERIIGREPTSVNCNTLTQRQDVIEAMKKFQGEENIGVALVDEFGQVKMLADNVETPTKYSFIPIAGLFVGDLQLGGLEAEDLNQVMWKFFPNWSDKAATFKPTDFNPLTDLITPAV